MPLLSLAIVNRSYDELETASRPADPNQPESVFDVLYDTQQYAAAGQARLTFFNGTAANASDQTLSNAYNGLLPRGHYFEVHRGFVFPQGIPSVTTTAVVTGVANDVELWMKAARPVVTFNTRTKPYGPLPLEFYGRPGGPVPFAAAEGTETAPGRNLWQYGHIESNGGAPYNGCIIIRPQDPFSVFMDMAVQAVAVAFNIRLEYLGVRHRPVS